MKLSRREFFQGIAGAAALACLPGGAGASLFIEDPRVKAWRLLDEAEAVIKAAGRDASVDACNALLVHLHENFKVTYPPSMEDHVENCRDLLRKRKEINWETCYESTFAIMIVREGLKYRTLPMVRAEMWKPFAKRYTAIVMAA